MAEQPEAQQSAKRKKKKEAVHHVIVTPSAIVITLDEKQQRQAKECLKKSGKLTLAFKELSITRLPEMGANSSVIID